MVPASRRLLRAAALLTAVSAGYVGGILTHQVSAPNAAPVKAKSSVLDEAANRIEDEAVSPVSRGELERAAVEGMLKTLGDRWSGYYDDDEYTSFSDAVEGRYSGVGVWLRPGVGTSVVVGSVKTDSPADKAGIEIGDEVVRIDGKDPGSVNEAASALRNDGGPQHVRVELRRGTGTYTVSLNRATIASANVTVEKLHGQVLRIAVTTFTRGVGKQVREALADAGAAADRGVVLDLRGNPGGLLTEGVEVASAFLGDGPVVSYKQRGSSLKTLDAIGKGDTATPLVVLVDGQTASAAEVVTGALQDRNRAVVVGAQTFGKGSVQDPIELSDGSAIEITVGRYFTPNGHDIDGVGITPDVLVSDGASPAVAEGRALDILSGLQAALVPAGNG